MKMNNEIKTYLSEIGKKGGSKKTDKKINAARENGKKGGRPRKTDNTIKSVENRSL